MVRIDMRNLSSNTFTMKKSFLILVGAFAMAGCGQKGAATGAAGDQPPAAAPASGISGPKTAFYAKSGSKMRIDGTANMIHKEWILQSTVIGGSLEVGPNFPTQPGQSVQPGKVEAAGKAFMLVSSFHSIEADGRPYKVEMDDRMYQQMKAEQYKRIEYTLKELTLQGQSKTNNSAYDFDSKGDLTICGVTKPIAMPVVITLMPNNMIKVVGSVTVKGTDFGVEPVTLKALGLVTGDDYKLSFEWNLGQRTAAAGAK
ncbi:MAG: hypothetical protein C5B50_25500 [Verrucomicrobia bacterium]|nr:MAG: hypothetical protein C5B50_25500 [Verrucomicrobiota bacterium]